MRREQDTEIHDPWVHKFSFRIPDHSDSSSHWASGSDTKFLEAAFDLRPNYLFYLWSLFLWLPHLVWRGLGCHTQQYLGGGIQDRGWNLVLLHAVWNPPYEPSISLAPMATLLLFYFSGAKLAASRIFCVLSPTNLLSLSPAPPLPFCCLPLRLCSMLDLLESFDLKTMSVFYHCKVAFPSLLGCAWGLNTLWATALLGLAVALVGDHTL